MPKIRLPAKLESLKTFLEFISGSARGKGFSEHRVKEIELVTEEVLVNIFSYAYHESPGEVEITDRKNEDDTLILKILDYGTPFDPLSLSEPELTAHVSDRMAGGLGVFFIRKMADDVRYRRDGDANILTLTFSK
ncbi:MAG: ATP-binding protein [Desulfobacteraceae bacterium]|nr:ATP-binding protein [Deltaproteobacteria bacterium]MCK4794421.1 ATP-binding protein [Desulfobacteraceae bacterium]